ncbi:MAG: AI-2E family transporter [Terriglobia bacterium]
MPEIKTERPLSAIASSGSLRIIAVAIILICVYYASSVLITLVCSILAAFVLEPGVRFLERIRVPRWLGALTMVLAALALIYLLFYAVYNSASGLVGQLPALTQRIREIVDHFQAVVTHLRQSASLGASSPENAVPAVRLQQQSGWAHFLLHGIGSVYSFTVTVMFIPFLIFFMLTSKNHLYWATVNLFPLERRQHAEDTLIAMGQMIRRYVLGNLLVALISMALITPAFLLIHLPYAVLLGGIAALLNLIPYIGVPLAILPPLLVSLVHSSNATPIIIIAVTVSVVHFIALNILTPKIVGSRVRLNALSVTIAMMFWGWLWGAMGLVLAVPITAGLKVVCDNVPSLKAVGHWLGEDD